MSGWKEVQHKETKLIRNSPSTTVEVHSVVYEFGVKTKEVIYLEDDQLRHILKCGKKIKKLDPSYL